MTAERRLNRALDDLTRAAGLLEDAAIPALARDIERAIERVRDTRDSLSLVRKMKN